MAKSSCGGLRPRRQRHRRTLASQPVRAATALSGLEVLGVIGRGLLGGLFGLLIDALRPLWPGRNRHRAS